MWRDGHPGVALPADVVLDGRQLTISFHTTGQLVDLVARGDWWNLLHGGISDDDRRWIDDRLTDRDDALELTDIWQLATTFGGELCGTGSWWAAHRILATAHQDWLVFDGWCLSRGYSPLDGPVWRVVAAGYQMLRDGAVVAGDPDKTIQAWVALRERLWTPPASQAVVAPLWSPDDESAAFMAGMAAITAAGVG